LLSPCVIFSLGLYIQNMINPYLFSIGLVLVFDPWIKRKKVCLRAAARKHTFFRITSPSRRCKARGRGIEGVGSRRLTQSKYQIWMSHV